MISMALKGLGLLNYIVASCIWKMRGEVPESIFCLDVL